MQGHEVGLGVINVRVRAKSTGFTKVTQGEGLSDQRGFQGMFLGKFQEEEGH